MICAMKNNNQNPNFKNILNEINNNFTNGLLINNGN